MAEFHLHGQIIKRSQGRSAVNAAAYRAGALLYDKRLDRTFDYRGKHDVEESVILGPEHAPKWMFDREMLWNTVEAAERHKAAQVAREFDIALPIELVQKDPAAAKEVLKAWAEDRFVAQGFMIDINFHKMGSTNPHAHIMMTMRRVHPQAMKFGEESRYAFEDTKARDQNDWGYMPHWRETWADYANAAMAAHGIDARIDHRTLIEQDIDREPGIHIGPVANAMEERGKSTGRWLKNAMIWFGNEEPWFEENRRYVAFLDAEAAEERQRHAVEAAKQEAERREIEAAAAIVARANNLENLARRLTAAVGGQVGRSVTGVASIVGRLDDLRKAQMVAAQLAFDDAVGGLARAKVQIEAGILGRRQTIAHVQVRFRAAAKRIVNSEASRLRGSAERLTPAVEALLGDDAVRFYDLADRLKAQAPHLRSRGKQLNVAALNAQAAIPKPEAAATRVETELDRRPAAGSQMAAQVLNRIRLALARNDTGVRSGAARSLVAGRTKVRSLTAVSIRSIGRVYYATAEAVGSAASRAVAFLKEPGIRGLGRERLDGRDRSTAQADVEAPAPVRSDSRGEEHEGELAEQRVSVFARARSMAASLRRARDARKAKVAAKTAKAAEAALKRNLRLAEEAVRAGIDRSTPDIELQFVSEWIRTLKSTEGPMVTRYEEADRVALKGYALGMNRYPQIGELDRVLIRLSPFAGGVKTSAKDDLQGFPDRMKSDLGRHAIYTKHVSRVAQELQADLDVINHFRQLLRTSVETEERNSNLSHGIVRAHHPEGIISNPGQGRDD